MNKLHYSFIQEKIIFLMRGKKGEQFKAVHLAKKIEAIYFVFVKRVSVQVVH